jgi:hypothetical protein
MLNGWEIISQRKVRRSEEGGVNAPTMFSMKLGQERYDGRG